VCARSSCRQGPQELAQLQPGRDPLALHQKVCEGLTLIPLLPRCWLLLLLLLLLWLLCWGCLWRRGLEPLLELRQPLQGLLLAPAAQPLALLVLLPWASRIQPREHDFKPQTGADNNILPGWQRCKGRWAKMAACVSGGWRPPTCRRRSQSVSSSESATLICLLGATTAADDLRPRPMSARRDRLPRAAAQPEVN
jgi:hypothetical protein